MVQDASRAAEESLNILITTAIECERAIVDWENHQARTHKALQSAMEEAGLTQYTGDAGTAAFTEVRGEVDYRAAFLAAYGLLLKLSDEHRLDIAFPDLETFRNPPSRHFGVRATLRRAPPLGMETEERPQASHLADDEPLHAVIHKDDVRLVLFLSHGR